MAVVITPESEMGMELAKWNKPYVYVEFPKMLYRAAKTPSGKWRAAAETPHPFAYANSADPMAFQRAEEMAHAFNVGCQLVVRSEDEQRKAMNEGWRLTIAEAEAYHERVADEISQQAANRHYHDQFMSEAAQREAKAADDAAGAQHVPDVPRKPGRPRKDASAA